MSSVEVRNDVRFHLAIMIICGADLMNVLHVLLTYHVELFPARGIDGIRQTKVLRLKFVERAVDLLITILF